MKLVFTDPPIALSAQTVSEIRQLPGIETAVYDSFAVDEAELYERGKDAEIIVTDLTVYRVVLRRWPKLRVIITTSVGTDHIDVAYCLERGIRVVNFPGYNARAVAEMTIAILIGLLRKVPMAQRYARGGGWDFQYFEGEELAGKTFGMIGAGNVGRELIKIAQGLEMRIMVHTAHPSRERAVALGLEGFVDLQQVLRESDFLVLAVPANLQTEHLIGVKQLAQMKVTAFLVNMGRGKLIDTVALADALYRRKLAGAALDVIEGEPFNIRQADLRIQEMINSNNVVLTPHIAFNTKESTRRLGERVIQEIAALTA
jgi:phosphoglycerate dehydrogenase-like enzyme